MTMESYGKLNKIFNLTKCCCCSGRTAVLIIGWLGLIYTFGGFITACVTGPSEEENVGIAEVKGAFLAFIFVYKFISNGGLLFGVYKNRPLYMYPWLCLHMTIALVIPVLMILLFLMSIGSGAAFGFFVLLGCILGLYIYAVLVVHTYYENLRSREVELFFALQSPNAPTDLAQSPPVML